MANHTLTAAKLKAVRASYIRLVRDVLTGIPRAERCDPTCKGWAIFNESEGRPEIQRCDDCTRDLPVSDFDVAALPEAQTALRGALARLERIEAGYPRTSEAWKAWRKAEPRG
jgi:hypothetical protein